MQHDPAWKDNLLFNEYFHGDNGASASAAEPPGRAFRPGLSWPRLPPR